MAFLVQIIMGGALLTVIILGIIVFIKSASQKGGKSSILKFLLIELLLVICSAVFLYVLSTPPVSISGLIIISIGLAMLANLPMAIIAKLIQVFFGKKKEPLPEKLEPPT